MSQYSITGDDAIVTVTIRNDLFRDQLEPHLPVKSRISTWGDEIYFPVPVEETSLDLTRDVSAGDVAYWPGGQSLAVFFGPTPISPGDQPVPADDVSVIGSVEDNLSQLDSFEAGNSVTFKKSE